MPEGDTVFVSAARMNAALASSILSKTDFRIPSLATTDLSGREVIEVVPRGKHMFTRISGDLTLHTHFKMQGAWETYRRGQRWRGPVAQVRVVLSTDSHEAVGFRIPVIELLPTAEEERIVAHLGPDPLGPDWDESVALQRFTAMPHRPVSDALLDQSVMAGPGNVYKSEICFLSGLHPSTEVGSISDPMKVVRLTARVMRANRKLGRQITTGDTRAGRGQWVYGRRAEPCRRCGTPIEKSGSDEQRVTYWCPNCQPVSGR